MHVGAGQVEHQLVALLGARTAGEVQHPVRMRAIEVGVGVDHLRLDPEAEVHAERVNLVDERLEAVGKLLLVYIPVAQAGVVVFALAEPAVVHDEAVDAERGGLFGQRHLAGLGDVELGCLPGVVNHWAQWARQGCGEPSGQNVLELEAMEQARSAAEAVWPSNRRRRWASQAFSPGWST